MKINFCFLLIAAIASACNRPEGSIVRRSDYVSFLDRKEDRAMKSIEAEKAFCDGKLAVTPSSTTYLTRLAGFYSARFMLNGRIEDIATSDSIYRVVLKNTPGEYSGIHRALAANCITQHKFREAKAHINKAIEIGDNKAASLFMLADVDIELGDLPGARFVMQDFINKNTFPWLIRQAKIKDHEGHLDSAILLMEKALTKVVTNQGNSLWTLSNLADMYGHAGRVSEAYQTYLRVLELDPDYDYALRGIAWIAFSHDHDYSSAREIANVILRKRATPDMYLFLAQIAKAEGNIPEKEKLLTKFTAAAQQPKYGDMYNKYLALLDADEFSNPSGTLLIAKREISNRPTTQSFDLLAWGYYRAGQYKEALDVAREHLENRTSEPDALFHLGMIYKKNGLDRQAHECLERASEGAFELGPEKARIIKDQLSG